MMANSQAAGETVHRLMGKGKLEEGSAAHFKAVDVNNKEERTAWLT